MKTMQDLPKLFDDTIYTKLPFNDGTPTRKQHYQNIHISHGMKLVGLNEIPEVLPYNDEIPISFTPYTLKKHGNINGAIHFYIDDYRFAGMYMWGHLKQFTNQICRYKMVVAPDFSIFLDQSRTLNLFQIYQNRVIAAYWQQLGLRVIPSVSWGNADSFDYCFDGLPQNSVLSIGGVGTAHNASMVALWEYGVHKTIERLNPKALVIYGAPKQLDLPIDTYYFTDYIHSKYRH